MIREPVDIIVPTFNNIEQLSQCVSSIMAIRSVYPIRFIIVNNGKDDVSQVLPDDPEVIKIIQTEDNLGWTGGLAEGLKHSTSEYVMFANDDIYVPPSSFRWMRQMVRHLDIFPQIAAVGPATNCAMGSQNIFAHVPTVTVHPTYLIGFCMLVRRKTLDEVGGIDVGFPTGDDIDLSIRFLKAGHALQVDRTVFVYHHGFQTGTRLYGDHTRPGGWNSQKMTDDTNKMLIDKHGFKAWWLTMCKSYSEGWGKERWNEMCYEAHAGKRSEDDAVISFVNGCQPEEILEIGCGGRKTVEGSVGLDKESPGTPIPYTGRSSVADVVADAQDKLPFEDGRFKTIIARHVLEHIIDTLGALRSWKNALSDDGTMIISVPDERITDSILADGNHVHAFTPSSLSDLAKAVGLKVTDTAEYYGSDSFTMRLEKEVA